MDHKSYTELKSKVKNKDFFNSYAGLEKISYRASFIGNLFSILFAYFMVYESIMKAVLEPSTTTIAIVSIITLAILIGFEAIKRFVFDSFSVSLIRNKFGFNTSEIIILSIFSLSLITGSFYLSLTGAMEYASRDKQIKEATKSDINTYTDSLKTDTERLIAKNDSIFGTKMVVYEKNNVLLFEDNRKYDTYIEQYTVRYNDPMVSNSDKNRIKSEIQGFRSQKDKNLALLQTNNAKIDEYTKQRDEKNKSITDESLKKASVYETEKSDDASAKIVDNKTNSVKFLVFSTIIEFVILFGIYFRHHYEYRSVTEHEEKIKSEPNYKKFHAWNILLDIILGNGDESGTPLPYKKDMIKLLNANKIDMSQKDFDDALKVFTHLGILKTRGNKKTIATDLETARSVVMKYLKID